MLLLALDTATSAITAAVHDGERLLAEDAVLDARRHTETLAPVIERVLGAAGAEPGDLTDIAVGVGPGPYTGLRVGLVTARTLGFALGIPVHGVCSLDALAAEAAGITEGELLVAADARRKEVYWARYVVTQGLAERVEGPEVVAPAQLPARVRELPTAGRGPDLYPDLFANPVAPHDVSAAILAEVALRQLAEGRTQAPEPLYLRRPDAQEPAIPKSTLVGGNRP